MHRLWIVLLWATLPTFAVAQTSPIVPERPSAVPNAATPPKPTAPNNDEEWKARRNAIAAKRLKALPAIRERLGVDETATTIAGVNCFVTSPRTLPEQNKNRVLFHLHGGNYVFLAGEAGTWEAVLMAGYGHMKVISVDYRMAPEAPYPAGLDDAVAVWKAMVQSNKPENMAAFGHSAGGGMTLALMLRLKQDGLPLPAAMGPAAPGADLTGSGDSNEHDPIDDAAAKLYANGHDLKDPLISPLYGDFSGLPPAIITTGTRDDHLSDAVNVHRKLLQAGGVAELYIFDGFTHGQWQSDPWAPETAEAFTHIAQFFDRHMGR